MPPPITLVDEDSGPPPIQLVDEAPAEQQGYLGRLGSLTSQAFQNVGATLGRGAIHGYAEIANLLQEPAAQKSTGIPAVDALAVRYREEERKRKIAEIEQTGSDIYQPVAQETSQRIAELAPTLPYVGKTVQTAANLAPYAAQIPLGPFAPATMAATAFAQSSGSVLNEGGTPEKATGQGTLDAGLALATGGLGKPVFAGMKTLVGARNVVPQLVRPALAAAGTGAALNAGFSAASSLGPAGSGDPLGAAAEATFSPQGGLTILLPAALAGAHSYATRPGPPIPPPVDPAIAAAAAEAATQRVQGRKLLNTESTPNDPYAPTKSMGVSAPENVGATPVIEDPMARQRVQGIVEKEALLKNFAAREDAQDAELSQSARDFEEQRAIQDSIEAQQSLKAQQENEAILKNYVAGRQGDVNARRTLPSNPPELPPEVGNEPPTGPNPLTSFSQLRKQGLKPTEPTNGTSKTSVPETAPVPENGVAEPSVAVPDEAIPARTQGIAPASEEAAPPANTESVSERPATLGENNREASGIEHLSPKAQTYFNEQSPAVQKELMSTVNARTNRLDTAGDERNLKQHVQILKETNPQLFKESTNETIPNQQGAREESGRVQGRPAEGEQAPAAGNGSTEEGPSARRVGEEVGQTNAEESRPGSNAQGTESVEPGSSGSNRVQGAEQRNAGQLGSVLRKGPRSGSVPIGGGPSFSEPLSKQVDKVLKGADTRISKLMTAEGEAPGAPGTSIHKALSKVGILGDTNADRKLAQSAVLPATWAASSTHGAKAMHALTEFEAQKSVLTRKATELDEFTRKLTPEQNARLGELALAHRHQGTEDYASPVTIHDEVTGTEKTIAPTPVEAKALELNASLMKDYAEHAKSVRDKLIEQGAPDTTEGIDSEISAKNAEASTAAPGDKERIEAEVQHLEDIRPIFQAAETMDVPSYFPQSRPGKVLAVVKDGQRTVAVKSFHSNAEADAYAEQARASGHTAEVHDNSAEAQRLGSGAYAEPGFLKKAENVPGADTSNFSLAALDYAKRFSGFAAKAELRAKWNQIRAEAPRADRLVMDDILNNLGKGDDFSANVSRALSVFTMGGNAVGAVVQGLGGIATSLTDFSNFHEPTLGVKSALRISREMLDVPKAAVEKVLNRKVPLGAIFEDNALARLKDPQGYLKRAFNEGILSTRGITDTGASREPTGKLSRGADALARTALTFHRMFEWAANVGTFRTATEMAEKNAGKASFWKHAQDLGYAGETGNAYEFGRWFLEHSIGRRHSWARPLIAQRQGIAGTTARVGGGLLNYTTQQGAKLYNQAVLAPMKAAAEGRGTTGLSHVATLTAAFGVMYALLGPNMIPGYSSVHSITGKPEDEPKTFQGLIPMAAKSMFGTFGEEAAKTLARRASPVATPAFDPQHPILSAVPILGVAKNLSEGNLLPTAGKQLKKAYTIARGENIESGSGKTLLSAEEINRYGQLTNIVSSLAGLSPIGIDRKGREVSLQDRRLEEQKAYNDVQAVEKPRVEAVKSLAKTILDFKRGKIAAEERKQQIADAKAKLIEAFKQAKADGIVVPRLTSQSLNDSIRNELGQMQELPTGSKTQKANRMKMQGLTRGE